MQSCPQVEFPFVDPETDFELSYCNTIWNFVSQAFTNR